MFKYCLIPAVVLKSASVLLECVNVIEPFGPA